MQLQAGDEVSYFAEGRAYANEFLDIYVKPALNLWCKVGDSGEVFRGTRGTTCGTWDRQRSTRLAWARKQRPVFTATPMKM